MSETTLIEYLFSSLELFGNIEDVINLRIVLPEDVN